MHTNVVLLVFALGFASLASTQDPNVAPPAPVGGPPANRVTITVGETGNNFKYTANGVTYTPNKIDVSGQYYNNDFVPASGYADLFLTVTSGVDYWDTHFGGPDRLNVYVENFHYDPFYFEVIVPDRVPVGDLAWRQINETTILVKGPPKAYFY